MFRLAPDPQVTPEDLSRGKTALVQDAAWASIVGSLYGGVILVGFALEAGATPFLIGLIAAVPFLAQLGQLPAIVLIERLRQRRKIAVVVAALSRSLIFALALLPWLDDYRLQLALVLGAQIAISLFGAFAACSVNSWLHQLLAGEDLGAIHARRLFWSTVLAAMAALAAGSFIEHGPLEDRLHAYSLCFAAAGIAGFVGLPALARVPEPPMHASGPPAPVLRLLTAPLADSNFRRLIVFIAAWNFASNIAAPFLTVYLLRQQGFGLGTVSALWAASQMASAVTLYWWGKVSDRLSNKALLATAIPAYFGCLVALPASTLPGPHELTLPLIGLIHVVMGMASGGIALATGNIGLKLAPQGRGTAYLGAVSLAGALAAGAAALTGGALAGWFKASQLSIEVRWTSLARETGIVALRFAHWEFLFAIAFALGMYVLHALSRVREGDEISERTVMRNFALEAGRSMGQVSSTVATTLTELAPFGRLFDRRRRSRRR